MVPKRTCRMYIRHVFDCRNSLPPVDSKRSAMKATALQRPTDFLMREEIDGLRSLNPWWASFQILHCWATILLVWVLCSLWPNPLMICAGVLIVGGRQLGLGIINHDAAHFLLFKNRALNDWVTQWLLLRPLLGSTVDGYRKYHLDHHRYTQKANDPDLPLSAPFPITRKSFYRKMWRDLSGQTGWKAQTATLRNAFGRADEPVVARLRKGFARLGPNLAINLAFLGGFVWTGHWYLYFLLWIAPNLTWLQFISRVRNIGEHAAVPDNDDRLRNTRTVSANRLERLLLAPYFVNYHLEHHLLVSCPCYHLPKMHRLLIAKGFGAQMELQPNYLAMLRHAVSRVVSTPAAA